MEKEVIKKILREIASKIRLTCMHTTGYNPELHSDVASEISTILKKSTGVDFKVVVTYDENQPNQLVVGIKEI